MRALLTLLFAALAFASALQPADARSRRAVPASGVVIDVSALRARGLTAEADLIQRTIASEIAQNGPRGRVHVRITALSLTAFVGGVADSGRYGGGGGSSGSDFLEGDFQVLGPQGEVLAGRSLLVNAPASSGGAWYLPGVDQRRIQAVARSFAGWVRQYGG